jgi:hypothetical protein
VLRSVLGFWGSCLAAAFFGKMWFRRAHSIDLRGRIPRSGEEPGHHPVVRKAQNPLDKHAGDVILITLL